MIFTIGPSGGLSSNRGLARFPHEFGQLQKMTQTHTVGNVTPPGGTPPSGGETYSLLFLFRWTV